MKELKLSGRFFYPYKIGIKVLLQSYQWKAEFFLEYFMFTGGPWSVDRRSLVRGHEVPGQEVPGQEVPGPWTGGPWFYF